MHFLVTLALAIFCSTSVVAQGKNYVWSAGEYKRINDGFGSLTILRADSERIQFKLLALYCYTGCGDPANEINNGGQIDDGTITVKGNAGVYKSSNEEDDDLGHCILFFKRNRQDIVITQGGTCWWFGDKVNASGVYQLQGVGHTTGATQRR